jgi:hypothetical protein
MKQRFVTELGRDYLVVEVALYPKEGTDLQVQPDQFVLHIAGQDRALRSENPKVIAASTQKSEGSKRDISIVPHADIGYESGRRYDPTTGTNSSGGIVTSTGVAVLVGESSPGADPRNEDVVALELSEKALPEGTFNKPVAGHLYFRIGKEAAKDAKAKYELAYELNGKAGSLALKR